LERDGLIHSLPGADKRIRIVSATNKGRKFVEDAEPKWPKAQEALIETIREDRWRAMCTLLRDTTRMVRHWTITAD
jgi:DNA-binding MarR family transcriptional regulator